MIKHDEASRGNKLLRLFQLLLINGNRHFQTDIEQYLKCSKQTVISLIEEIESVVGDRLEYGLDNRRKWYRLTASSRSRPSPNLGLDYEELRYLSLCRDLAQPYLTEDVRDRIDQSILELSMLLADVDYAQRQDARESQCTFYSKGRIDYRPHAEHIDALVRAAREQRVCRISYRAPGRKPRKHVFLPGRILAMNNALYVAGATLNDDFQTVRHMNTLAIHRMLSVEETERTLAVDFPELDRSHFGMPWHEPRTFRVRFLTPAAADYVRERIWSENQVLTNRPDGTLDLELTVTSEVELMAWVRSFGKEAMLLADCGK